MESHSEERPIFNEYIYTRFFKICEKYPQKTAIVYLGNRWTYAELKEDIYRFAGNLSEIGVGKSDRVMLYIPNCYQWIVAFFGIQILGAHAVPTSPVYTAHEIEYIAKNSDANTIICQDTNYCYVREVLSRTPLERVIVTNLADSLPVWKRAIGFLCDKVPRGSFEKGVNIYKFSSLLKNGSKPNIAEVDPREISFILYTGGTTGFPKGVPLNHLSLASFVNDMTDHIFGERLTDGNDCYVCVNPLFHIMAFAFFLIFVLNKGNKGVLMPVPQVDAILRAVERYRATLFLGVPTLYRMILESDRLSDYDLSSVKYALSGGDKLAVEICRKWKEVVGIPIHGVYGSTEMGFVTCENLDEEPNLTELSIGECLPSRDGLIVDPETLEPVPEGEVGELLVTCEYAIKEYLNKPEETARSYVDIDGKFYYRMGDFIKKNRDGKYYYVDRSVDVIKYKGYRVSASEIETVIQDHPTVVAVCVVGVPDEKVGERIKAIVVLKEDARGVSGSDLLRFCRNRLASYKMPKYIEFRDMLPKSKVGKLLRREVRDEEIRKLG